MTTTLKQSHIKNEYYISLDVSVNHQGLNVYCVQLGRQINDYEVKALDAKFYKDRTQATKAYNYYRRKFEKLL